MILVSPKHMAPGVSVSTAFDSSLGKTNTMSLTGGDAIVEMLERADVGPVFGMAGFQLLPYCEALRKKRMRHFPVNDERILMA